MKMCKNKKIQIGEILGRVWTTQIIDSNLIWQYGYKKFVISYFMKENIKDDVKIENSRNGIEVTNCRTSQIIQIQDQEVEDFLTNHVNIGHPVVLPVSTVIATGGEAVIIANPENPDEVI